MKKNNIRTISILSLQHMLVDFICAAVMYHKILNGQGNQAVIYNMCAFALQMPFGLMADLSRTKISNISALFVCGSVPFLAAGCMGSCILLGIGNALFHVGGGIITINADYKGRFEGRGLGCFVAPGAIGLVCGKLLSNYVIQITIGVLIILAVLCTVLLHEKNEDSETSVSKIEINPDLLITVICCFLVVLFRSYVGLKMTFAWRISALLIFISVVVLAAGKTLGGFAAPVFGMRKTIIVSLVGA
ncbi:MAG: hypothetical protein IJI05_04960, partial [Erysipelotrichaceae bacterium]|nr:hypothetical protein [Erysipelotrichaceae bacterium]